MYIDEALYRRIVEVMPIPCVDLLVTEPEGRILLVKRKKEPAAGQWWFPGGRVHFGETREEAASRKLKEECGLTALRLSELGTLDVILPLPKPGTLSHGITTLFAASVPNMGVPVLDSQSSEARWRTRAEWLAEPLPGFVREGMGFSPRNQGPQRTGREVW